MVNVPPRLTKSMSGHKFASTVCTRPPWPPTKPPTNHEMEIRPVSVVGSARRPYGKGPQRSGGHDSVKRFFMGVRRAATAASQVRPLELLAAILAAPRRSSWYTHEKSLKIGVTARSLRSFSIWAACRSDHGNRSYYHFVVGQGFVGGAFVSGVATAANGTHNNNITPIWRE